MIKPIGFIAIAIVFSNNVLAQGVDAIPPSLRMNNITPSFTSGDHSGQLTSPYEAMVVSNGKMHINAQVFSHELILNIGLNDTWGKYRISHPGDSRMEISSQCDTAQRTIRVEYSFPVDGGKMTIDINLDGSQNSVSVSMAGQGKIPWTNLTLEKQPDYFDASIPRPIVDAPTGTISQSIPGKSDWTISASFPGKSEETIIAYSRETKGAAFYIQRNGYQLKNQPTIVTINASGGV